ncbi:MAG: BTAD domain-containing putative transcriptional regulator, partial [Streptosporangiaceae bacterium]
TAGAGPVIPRGSGGYRTEVPRENVDLYRFRDLLTEARSARFPRLAATLCRNALDEWGPDSTALAGLPGDWAASTRRDLAWEHRAALVAGAELDLELGEHHRLIPDLHRAVEGGPVDEKLTCLLMLALYRAGRTTDVHGVYARVEQRLETEIEAPPGPELTDLYRRIQWDDPALRLPYPPSGENMRQDATAALAAATAEIVARGGRPTAAPVVEELAELLEGRLVGPDEKAALTWAQRSPDDGEAVASLAKRLLRHLTEDAGFARQVARLVERESSPGDDRTNIRAETIEKLTIFQKKVQVSGDLNI